MKSFKIHIADPANTEVVEKILDTLVQRGLITFETDATDEHESDKEATPATEAQVQEIIEEAELGPYYSEKEAKDILKL